MCYILDVRVGIEILFIFTFGLLTCNNIEMNYFSEHLNLFEPYIGRTYKGEFANSTKDSFNKNDSLNIKQQLILKHESYLDKVSDCLHGSYYIETITKRVLSSGLSTFGKPAKNDQN